MKTTTTFLVAILVSGFFFLSYPATTNAGFAVIPGGPPCCEGIGLPAPVCRGGEAGVEMCQGIDCDRLDCEFLENSTCVAVSNFEGFCERDEPTLPPIATNVPAMNGWGVLSLVVILALIGLGAILARKKKASA